ncbi:MAG: thiol-disulfide isomerase/thioredoxin [Planctomycetota bacterium]|jgi:thiol-disulfide isomerase/thioredoxin
MNCSHHKLIVAIALYSLLIACRLDEVAEVMPPSPTAGIWHGQLNTPGGPLAIGLEFKKTDDGRLSGFIINGSESIEIPQVAVIGDTLILAIDHYDSKLEAKILDDGNKIEGTWKKRRGPDRWGELPFVATAGTKRRFAIPDEKPGPAFNFEGRWRARFASDEDDCVATFAPADAGDWTGTFMTTTGDYRYLAGCVDGSRLRLSCFDGAHAFLFDASAQEDGTLKGGFWNWNTWHDTWVATRDSNVELPDGFKQTKWNGEKTLTTMEFPDLGGKKRKLSDLLSGGKVQLLQIFGSWCPNCHDATNYLVDLEQKYGLRGLKICGVAFELSGDFERDAEQVMKYAALHGTHWPMVIGGTADKKMATKAFGGVDFIRSYPTLVFFDSAGKVEAVYSGFSGPATGKAHTDLKARIEELIERLLERP